MGSVTFNLDITTGTGSGGHGRLRKAMRRHGFNNIWLGEAMGSVIFGSDTTIGTGSGGHGRLWEATGDHGFGNFCVTTIGREAMGGQGRQRDAMGPVTSG